MNWKSTVFLLMTMLYLFAAPVFGADVTSSTTVTDVGETGILTGSALEESENLPTLNGSSASDVSIILDAGLIEWTEGYLKAEEGFELQYGGKRVTGDRLFYDSVTGEYLLNDLGFRTCVKDNPHYMVLAKRLEIYPEERLVFTGVRLRVGSIEIPLPFGLVLNYQNGQYRFPDWLPEMFYNQEGLGLKFKGSYTPHRALQTSAALAVATSGDINLDATGKLNLGAGLVLDGSVVFDEQWAGGANVNWRKGQEGFRGMLEWSKPLTKQARKTGNLGYASQGWVVDLSLTQVGNDDILPVLQFDTPNVRLGKVTYNSRAVVTEVTENVTGIRHDKVYNTNYLRGNHALGKGTLTWALQPTVNWVAGYGLGSEGAVDVGLKLPIGSRFKLDFGYGRVDHWDQNLPQEMYTREHAEYASAGLQYHQRNEFDEGWDVEISGKYALDKRAWTTAQTNIVKAYDCFDLKVGIDLVQPSINVGIGLKY